MRVSLIVAVAENGVIGRDNTLPWYLPNDLKYFKSVTMGKPIIMGRKTHESIGMALPGRVNIVISRQQVYEAPGCEVVNSLAAAVEFARIVATDSAQEVLVIGGAEIYQQALPFAQRLYLTEVHASVSGDAFFPARNADCWKEISRERFKAEGENPYDYSFVVYKKNEVDDESSGDHGKFRLLR